MTQMTDEEAKEILNDNGTWIPCWNEHSPQELWEEGLSVISEPYVTLDGNYTRKELLAMLHFHPNKEE